MFQVWTPDLLEHNCAAKMRRVVKTKPARGARPKRMTCCVLRWAAGTMLTARSTFQHPILAVCRVRLAQLQNNCVTW